MPGRAGYGRRLTGWVTAMVAVATVVTVGGAGLASAASSPGDAASPGDPAAHASAAPPDIVTAPIQIAHTSDGDVGYREVGRGSPLLLITGFSATMDDWAPDFVDALAAHHRVVVFDNAGAGDTAPLAAPLTISAMAQQTSALITALRLGRPAVLGWSMGGMTAQALAVLHPDQVSRLVLAATQAGTGKALPIPPAAQQAAESSNPATVLSVLFPADQTAAIQAYVDGILQYPSPYAVSDAVKAQQEQAVAQWMAGGDPAGRRIRDIRARTLVADGTVDALDPVGNAWLLAHSVRDAGPPLLYPDAGHAFLFQDEAAFVPAIDRFLR
jgi:pimeloyl-ACP methyl ester carboxylesterase